MVVFFRWIIHLKKKKTYSKKNYKHLQTASHIKQTNTNRHHLQNRHHLLASKTKKKRKSRAPLMRTLPPPLEWARKTSLPGEVVFRELPMGLAGQTPGIHYMKCHLNMESISKRSTCHLPSINF